MNKHYKIHPLKKQKLKTTQQQMETKPFTIHPNQSVPKDQTMRSGISKIYLYTHSAVFYCTKCGNTRL